MQFKYIDIFAGCGGLSLGLYNSGWEGLFAIEKNADAFHTLKHNLIDKKNHFSWIDWLPQEKHDINDVIKDYKSQLIELKGKVQLIVGGPPCQGFSMAGQRNKNDARNDLVNSYIKFVELIRPKYLFFENVHGFTVGFKDKNNKKTDPTSKHIINELNGLGYKIDYRVLYLSDYGVPQKRKRFILIGCLNDEPGRFFKFLNSNRESFLKSKGLKQENTAAAAIGDLLASNKQVECPDSKNFMSGTYGDIISEYQRYMRKDIDDNIVPNSHRYANHKEETTDLFTRMLKECDRGKRLNTKNTTLEGFKRRGVTIINANEPCNTITSIPDDYLHYLEPRIMTVRECARIQSFPDWFEVKGKYTTGGKLRKVDVPRYTQIGNAIPPLFAEQVGNALKDMINNGK